MLLTEAPPRVVVVGGGYAGLGAALALAAGAPGRADIVLVDAAAEFPQRIRTHQRMAGQTVATPAHESLLGGPRVRVHRGRVDAIDRTARVVRIGETTIAYDRLVWAAGSSVARDVPGADAHAIALDPGASIDAVRRRLDALSRAGGGRVVVAGAGLTGVEVAAEIAESYPMLRVQLVGRTIGDGLGDDARAYIARTLEALGVDLHPCEGVRRVEAGTLVSDRGELPFDLCLWTIGFTAPALAGAAGLAVNARGQVLVDPALRSITDAAVYAAGDCALPIAPVGAPIVMSCRIGGPMGFHVGRNLARELTGRPVRAFHYRDILRCVSLGRRRGLVERRHPDGRVRGILATGRLGAWIKERVCRATLWAVHALAWHARWRGRSSRSTNPRLAISA
jgi:NADH dehydrogenase